MPTKKPVGSISTFIVEISKAHNYSIISRGDRGCFDFGVEWILHVLQKPVVKKNFLFVQPCFKFQIT
jgi:phosphopantetheine adenylyltransferase